MGWYQQETNHYLSLCWRRYLVPYLITGPQCVNTTNFHKNTHIRHHMACLSEQFMGHHLQAHNLIYVWHSSLQCCSQYHMKFGHMGLRHKEAPVLLPGLYQLIAKPGNKTAMPLWSDPYILKVPRGKVSSLIYEFTVCLFSTSTIVIMLSTNNI